AIRERDGVSFLQTDAAMNAGNSGGPITLTNGLVIGLASASFAVGGNDTEGINFAINLVVHRDAVAALMAGD
ncbi:MAG: trypsin-like serine protease, partial [Chloroflexi bacterium]|nr:trypsin-like serine protease [Chloroflexota bacterium]